MKRLPRFVAGVLALAGLAALAAAQQPAPPVQAPMPEILKTYSAVTDDRLRTPADADWLMIRRSYDGWGYSPLDQITPANVSRLSRPGCSRPASAADTKPRRS